MTRPGIVPSGLPCDPTWLAHPDAFGLQPDLPLTPGQHFASAQGGEARDALHGAFSDAAPDGWGRRLGGGTYDRSIRLALGASGFFDIPADEACSIIHRMARCIAADWRDALRAAGVSGTDARRYQPAFETEESALAQALH